jgi:hypothetical protein
VTTPAELDQLSRLVGLIVAAGALGGLVQYLTRKGD